MKRLILSLLSMGVAMATLSGQNRYEAVISSSKIQWNAKKVTGEHTGTITLKEGWLDWKKNEIVSGKFVVDMTTIQDSDLKDEKMKRTLEGHLRSDDFFGVEKNPVSTLEITGKSLFVNGTGIVKGNLTIKGITLPIEFNATAVETKETITFTGKITVNRAKYDIRYGSGSFFSDLGDKLIYDDFLLDITLVVEKKKTN
jgi:polyisoprenoid-binding protein YceI